VLCVNSLKIFSPRGGLLTGQLRWYPRRSEWVMPPLTVAPVSPPRKFLRSPRSRIGVEYSKLDIVRMGENNPRTRQLEFRAPLRNCLQKEMQHE
jgi:hypothetical protein